MEMRNGTAGGAPQYSFKDGKLLIFSGSDVMLIRGWPVPTAVRKDNGRWIPFWPEFRLVSPYRPERKKADKPAAPQDAPGQMMFNFAAGDAGAKPVVKPTQRSLDARRRKRALNGFRFSLPKEIARVIEPFRSHQWPQGESK